MGKRRLVIFISALLLTASLPLFADDREIEELMRRDDYIDASLLVVSPGAEIYSAGGHVALRLSCPMQDVDYTYEFDAAINAGESLVPKYLNGTLQGAFRRLYTTDFMANASREGRTVNELPLNMTPAQEVRLWAGADDAVDSGAVYPFTPTRSNCCSMISLLIENAVGGGIFTAPSVRLSGSGRQFIEDFFSGSPWVGLLWDVLLGSDFDRDSTPLNLLYPKAFGRYLAGVTNPADGRPLSRGGAATDGFDVPHTPFTPTVLFGIMLLLSVFFVVTDYKKRLLRLSRIYDGILLTVTTAAGCVLWYMGIASLANGAFEFNFLALLCTPLPLLLLFVRKRALRVGYAIVMAVIAALMLAGICFVPQLRYFGLWMFVAAVLVRLISYLHTNYLKQYI